MSKPADNVTELSETLILCEFKSGGNKGFWLYDEIRGMNLAMRAVNETAAFVEALGYYQERLLEIEKAYSELNTKVITFVQQVTQDI